MINEVIIMGENHWGSNPGAHLITNFLLQVSLPFPTFALHHAEQEMECSTVPIISLSATYLLALPNSKIGLQDQAFSILFWLFSFTSSDAQLTFDGNLVYALDS